MQACYQAILGRPPESEAVVDEKLHLTSIAALLEAFLTSPEATRRFPQYLSGLCVAPAGRIEVSVPPEVLAQMFERVRRAWTLLGETSPFWSVVTKEEYRSLAPSDPAVGDFLKTGAETALLIDAFAQRAGYVPKRRLCVEFGAGVGRVTAHLAERFERVIAIDVSPRNLAIARDLLSEQGVANVDFMLLEAMGDLQGLPACDLLFSTLTFQHNPPPVQKHLLDQLFKKVDAGGAALVQLPTHTPGYSFVASDYLAWDYVGLEMHCLPMPVVFALMAEHGLAPREVLMDGWTGLYGSHTFFAVKA